MNSKIGYVDITIPSMPITVTDNGVYYTNVSSRGSMFYPFVDSANRISCMSATSQTVTDLIIRVWYVTN